MKSANITSFYSDIAENYEEPFVGLISDINEVRYTECLKLTINYYIIESNGTTHLYDTYTNFYKYGEKYSVVSPIIEGYQPTKTTISDTIYKDTSIIVNYIDTSDLEIIDDDPLI